MLKNVAIPLMLAASEAEAQRKASKAEVTAALDMARAEDFKGLQADAAACTVASSTTTDGISAAAGEVTTKEGLLASAESAVTALQAADGAWGLADEKRKASVAAAVLQEAAANISGLLDTADTKAGVEREKAALYVAADKAYQAGVRRASAAQTAVNNAVNKLSTLNTAKETAVNAAAAVRTQHAKESLWREWLYCELGGLPADEALPAGANGWWYYLANDTGVDGSSQKIVVTTASTAPAYCTVPEVNDGATSGPTVDRVAVKFYPAKTTLTSEPDDGLTRWTATLKATDATTALNAASSFQGQQRNKTGEVAWRTGQKASMDFKAAQRKKENELYTEMQVSRGTAQGKVNTWATSTSETALTGPDTTYGFGTGCPTDANACKTAAKWLADEQAARISTTSGSGINMPCSRAESGDATHTTTWTLNAASINSFKTNNGTAGATALWWAAARDFSEKMADWHTFYAANVTKITVGNAAFVETAVEGNSSAKVLCNVATLSSSWEAKSGGTSATLCKAQCETYTRSSLVINPNYTPTGGAVDNGGEVSPNYTTTGSYCGAYQFDVSGGTGCKILKDSDTVVKVGDTQADIGDVCAVMNAASNGSDAASSKAFQAKQNAVKVAWAAITSTLRSNMVSALDGQAALEQAWLNAYYDKTYWDAVNTELTTTTTGSKAKDIQDNKIAVLTSSQASGTVDSMAYRDADANQASSDLVAAQASLTALEATVAVTTAVVTELGKRITRATAEMAELNLLSTVPAPSTGFGTGTLDLQAKLRTEDWEAFASDGNAANFGTVPKGDKIKADEEKVAADLEVKPRSATGVTDGGTLTEARALAQAAWDLAKGEASTAEGDLSTALGSNDLAALRATIVQDTSDWDGQEAILAGLVTDVTDAELALAAAQKDLADKTMACQIAAYDRYRETLEGEMIQRGNDLKAIKALLEAEVTPAPGTIGARCEKALSNGTWRPKRRDEVDCGSEENCCGAARVWMKAGAGTADAAWRTIETCQVATDTTYMYQPARTPMDTAMPAKVPASFACIEGAKKLAAAASAVAAAYMLA